MGAFIAGKIAAGILFSLPVIGPALIFSAILVGWAWSTSKLKPVELLSGCLQVLLIFAFSFGVTAWLIYSFYKWIMSQ